MSSSPVYTPADNPKITLLDGADGALAIVLSVTV
jgi:hypothetical protein